MTHADAYDQKRRTEIYGIVLDHLRELAAHAKKMGLSKVIIEPTPLSTEFPSDPRGSLKLMKDLEGTTDVPVRLLVDWGHALFKPLLKEEADMGIWLDFCQSYIDCFHIQQTDGLLDRHWSFTQPGIVSVELVDKTVIKYSAGDLVQFVEVIYPFEATDEFVYEDIRETMRLLHNSLGGGR